LQATTDGTGLILGCGPKTLTVAVILRMPGK
jgi:hypothetical protein